MAAPVSPQQSAGLAEPSPSAFAAGGLGTGIKRLALASRIGFFPASVVPVLVGSAWGWRVAGHFDWLVFALGMVATVCVHLAANVLNDVGDEVSGTDRINEERIFPYTGGSRFIQNGVMSLSGMTIYGIALLLVSVAPGVALLLLRGPLVLAFGLAGVLLGVLYSLPRVQLAGRGVGEAVIAIAFGVIPVTGSAWLQSGRLDWAALLISLPVGLWVADILLMNEVPDGRADAQVGKRTLVVRCGVGGTRWIYFGLQLIAAGAVLLAGLLGLVPWWIAVLAVLLVPGAWRAAQGIRADADRATLTRSIQITLQLHSAGGALLITAALLGRLLASN
jgi:1,4-dihydroxy-2-naphthoate polyprenyltransferase